MLFYRGRMSVDDQRGFFMKSKLWILLILALVITACNNGQGQSTRTSSLPTPQISTTSVPDTPSFIDTYMQAWQNADYAAMYGMVSTPVRAAISQEDFSKKYQNTEYSLTMQSLDYSILSVLANPGTAQAALQMIYHTNLFGDLERQVQLQLVIEEGHWVVDWDEGAMLPELKGGKRLALDARLPSRGQIVDRNGEPLVFDTEVVALGLIPGQISDSQMSLLTRELAAVTGRTPEMVKDLIESSGSDWYLPMGEISRDTYDRHASTLESLSGLVTNVYTDRFYEDAGDGPQVLGYMLSITAEEMDAYRRLGYAGDEKVGKAGLEKWGNDILAGKPRADLYVVDAEGKVETRIAFTDPVPAQTIYTTLDIHLQYLTQRAILGFNGAIIVMERDTGRVLAMVSSPGYDPNLFIPANYNYNYQLSKVLNDPNLPLLNRATQSSYPPGSVYKVVTAAAALESGLFTPGSTYDCQHAFTDLEGSTLYDWTYAKELPPSGVLSLQEGIMRSCNPWFYHLGLDLYNRKGAYEVSNMARGFGLGQATGIDAVAEDIGSIPDPANEGEAVQLAIGQGTMLVTPLQIVDMYAAIGNGGTLYRPQIIEKIVAVDGTETDVFAPEERGKLPLSEANLTAIQQALKMVVSDKRGTAYRVFYTMDTPIYAKTGTATVEYNEPHSWFAGYTSAGRQDKPDIAIVVLAEHAGEGSTIAAPIFRRVVEEYFTGKPIRLYPWESSYYVTQTPSPEEEE